MSAKGKKGKIAIGKEVNVLVRDGFGHRVKKKYVDSFFPKLGWKRTTPSIADTNPEANNGFESGHMLRYEVQPFSLREELFEKLCTSPQYCIFTKLKL